MKIIREGVWALLITILVCLAAYAQPLTQTIPGGSQGVGQSSITNTTANVANSSTAINLTVPSRRVIIKTDPTAAIIYVDLAGGTATTADFRIEPGAAFVYEGAPISTFNYIGATATGTISIAAW